MCIGGRHGFAQILVERALPNLVAPNELEIALGIALGTRRQPFVHLVRERLRASYPESQLLRSIDARSAAREGDYLKAATQLTGSP